MDLQLQQLEANLIDAVQAYEYLYNKAHIDFKNAGKKQIAWTEIGRKLKTDAGDCIRLWRKARDHYSRERKGSASGSAAASSWPNFVLMSFMNNHVLTRKRISNIQAELETQSVTDVLDEESQESQASQEYQDSQESQESLDQRENSATEPGCSTPAASPAPRKKAKVEWQSEVASALTGLVGLQKPESNTMDDIVGKLVTAYLKEEKDLDLKEKKKNLILKVISSSKDVVEAVNNMM